MYICKLEVWYYCWSQGQVSRYLKRHTLCSSMACNSLAIHSFECKKCFFANSILLLMDSWKINSCRLIKPKSVWFLSTIAIMQTVKCDVFSACSTYYSQAQFLIREKLDQMKSNQEILERLQNLPFNGFLFFFPPSAFVFLELLQERKFKISPTKLQEIL